MFGERDRCGLAEEIGTVKAISTYLTDVLRGDTSLELFDTVGRYLLQGYIILNLLIKISAILMRL